MGYAFISYKSEERHIADSLIELFRQNGIESWVAPDDIPFGGNYPSAINRAIREANCFVILLSERAQTSQWILNETERAINFQKNIFTIHLDNVPMNDDFQMLLCSSQACYPKEINKNDDSISKLLNNIRNCTGVSEAYKKAALQSDNVDITTAPAPKPVEQQQNKKAENPPENTTSPANPDSNTPNSGFVIENGVLIKYNGSSSVVTIPNKVTEIGKNAFSHCETVTSIIIPDSVASIGDRAFHKCKNLTLIIIPDNVTNIGDMAFDSTATVIRKSDCFKSDNADSPVKKHNNNNSRGFDIKDGVLKKYKGFSSIVTIPDTVTAIGEKAFYNCSHIKSIIIPDSVTSIGNEAFSGCNYLTSVTIPESVAFIGDGAFGCTNISSIDVSKYNSNYISENGILFSKDKTTIIRFPTDAAIASYTIPSTVRQIAPYAFRNCKKLKSVTIHENVDFIGDGAFDCKNITSLYVSENNPDYLSEDGILFDRNKTAIIRFTTDPAITSYAIPNTVSRIASYAFSSCSNLTSVTIPDSVTSIGNYAFEYCKKLGSVTIPESVTFIGDGAFNCEKILSIDVSENNPNYRSENGVLFNKDKTKIIRFPADTAITSYTIPNTVKQIAPHAFSDCNNLTSITLPDSIINIDDYAFENCENLASITIPNGVTRIGDSAFSGCKTLVSISVPGSVTSIGNKAFCGCGHLTSVTIPKNVAFIGDSAFDCKRILSIDVSKNNPDYLSENGVLFNKDKTTLIRFTTDPSIASYDIPNTVKYIAPYAFSDCNNLTSIAIPDSVTSIGDYAFYFCENLASITIPNGVTCIGDSAFSYCKTLVAISIPDSVTYIGNKAFCNCIDLTSVTIPESVAFIGDGAFSHTYISSINVSKNNLNYLSENGILFNKDKTTLIRFTTDMSINSYTIPSTVEQIAPYAFSSCNNLTSITIPDSVTSIGHHAFSWCKSLTSITVPDGVTNIGDEAFSNCYHLTSATISESVAFIGDCAFDCMSILSIDVSINNQNYLSENGILFNKDKTMLIRFTTDPAITSYTIPNTVKQIAPYAFSSCKNLTSIKFPDSVTSIGDYAFECCKNLTEIMLSDSIISIGYCAFFWCENITSITIPNNTISIDDLAFLGCDHLASITIPESVTFIGDGAFDRANISSINVSENNLNYLSENGILFNKDKTTLIHFTTDPSITSYDIPNTVKQIAPCAFSHCENLTYITIPDSVTSIGDYAFEYCKNISSINIPDSVASVGYSAFRDCENLKLILHSNNVVSIEASTFSGCKNLKYTIIPDSVISIGESAFASCENLTSLTIPKNVAFIDNGAFGYMDIKAIDVSKNNPNYLSENGILFNKDKTKIIRFPVDSSIISYTIPNTVKQIAPYAFNYCNNLTSVTIPDSVISIGDYAFNGCNNLTSIAIPDSVISIGDFAFDWKCSVLIPENGALFNKDKTKIIRFTTDPAITSYTIPNTVKQIAPYAFRNCNNLISITIPDSVIDIGVYAFSGCKNLTSISIPYSVTYIGRFAFSDCKNLTSISIPYRVTNINDSVFYNCKNLSSVSIPDSVTNIGEHAFHNCEKLSSITIPDSVTNIGNEAFDRTTAVTRRPNRAKTNNVADIFTDFVIEKGVLISYKGESSEVSIPYGITVIGNRAFHDCSFIESVTIPDTVTNIGEEAFINCSRLTSVTIPANVAVIGKAAFCCKNVLSIDVSKNNTNYSSENGILFNKDKSTLIRFTTDLPVDSYNIPDSVKQIAPRAFSFCENLVSVTIPNSVKTIDETAFESAPEIIINCEEDSYAYKYAIEHNLKNSVDIQKSYRLTGVCQHCGGKFTGLLHKKCSVCGKGKDY